MLLDLAGRHVCISFATKRDPQVEMSLRMMQSIMFDCGEFTHFQQGGTVDREAYYNWLRPMLRPPHWAVVPDRIDGTVEEQRALVATWPFPKSRGAPVWHLGLPISYLIELARQWTRICFGSSQQYWKVGSPVWKGRMHEAFAALEDAGLQPEIHGLRMMNEAGNWPFASVDSVNIARNYKDREDMPGRMADRLDRVNPPKIFVPQRRLITDVA
ncbi:hypothetical protein [Metarhizobium album]|nr:hypothetical protein [Rhizobium album]